MKEGRFQIVRIGNHFTRSNFLVGSSVKTKFADAQAFLRTNWRPKRAAGQWAGFVELASSSFRMECGARFTIGEFSEALVGDLSFVQYAGRRIARKFPA